MKKEMKLCYPEAADTEMQKYYFLYRLQQKLQDAHNIWGDKYENNEITKAEWLQYLDEWYNPRSSLVSDEILRLRGLAKNHSWNVEIEDVFK